MLDLFLDVQPRLCFWIVHTTVSTYIPETYHQLTTYSQYGIMVPYSIGSERRTIQSQDIVTPSLFNFFRGVIRERHRERRKERVSTTKLPILSRQAPKRSEVSRLIGSIASVVVFVVLDANNNNRYKQQDNQEHFFGWHFHNLSLQDLFF